LGYQSGLNNIDGYGNTSVGSTAGDSITSGWGNTCLGFGTDVLAATDENEIVIGYNATGKGSNTGLIKIPTLYFGDGTSTPQTLYANDGYANHGIRFNTGSTNVWQLNNGSGWYQVLYSAGPIGPDGYLLGVVSGAPNWVSRAASTVSSTSRMAIVAGIQYADSGATIDKIVGSTNTFDPAALGSGTALHTLYVYGNVPASSDGYVTLYDATNHANVYPSPLLTAGSFELSVNVTSLLAAGSQRLELWIQTKTTTGGNLSCLHAELVTTFT
jgi:hypothetical protein